MKEELTDLAAADSANGYCDTHIIGFRMTCRSSLRVDYSDQRNHKLGFSIARP